MSLVEMFVRTARHYPDKLAVIDRATGARVSYEMALLRGLTGMVQDVVQGK